MREQSFKCHYCGEVVSGIAKIRFGVIWNKEKFSQPAWWFDMCFACTEEFFKQFNEGKNIRRDEVEAIKSKDWEKRYLSHPLAEPRSKRLRKEKRKNGEIKYKFRASDIQNKVSVMSKHRSNRKAQMSAVRVTNALKWSSNFQI